MPSSSYSDDSEPSPGGTVVTLGTTQRQCLVLNAIDQQQRFDETLEDMLESSTREEYQRSAKACERIAHNIRRRQSVTFSSTSW